MVKRLCRDCIWVIRVKYLDDPQLWKCRAPINGIDPVSGNFSQTYADWNRIHSGLCGPDGKGFQSAHIDRRHVPLIQTAERLEE